MFGGWDCSLVVQCLPDVCEALSWSLLGTVEEKLLSTYCRKLAKSLTLILGATQQDSETSSALQKMRL